MELLPHKRIKIVAFIAMVIFTVASAAVILIIRSGRAISDWGVFDIEMSWIVLMVFPLIALFTSYCLIHEEKRWIRKASIYSLYAYPLILVAAILILSGLSNTLLIIIIGIFVWILTILALFHIFVFSNPLSLTGTIIFIALLIASIVFKRYHLVYSGAFFSSFFVLFSLGCYMYGIRCLYLTQKNRFLKYVSFLGSCVVTITLMGLLFKIQHWPLNDLMVALGQLSLVLGTVVVMLTLPSAGYISWIPEHKKILNRIILPWAFIFLLFIIRFLLPGVHNIIWSSGRNVTGTSFEMVDYTIENKNGLTRE